MARDFALLLFQPFRIDVIIEIDFALKPKTHYGTNHGYDFRESK